MTLALVAAQRGGRETALQRLQTAPILVIMSWWIAWIGFVLALGISTTGYAQNSAESGSEDAISAAEQGEASEQAEPATGEPLFAAAHVAERPEPELSLDVDVAEELAEIQRRRDVAAALYASSTVLGVTAAAGVASGFVLLGLGVVGTSGSSVVGGVLLMGGGAVAFLGHIITMAFAISIDNGVGVRERRHREGQLDVALTGGPGEAGLGLRLAF